MARQKRELKRTFVVFCEGDTESNYFNSIRQLPTIDVLAKPINMHGGGYAHFLDEVKKDSRQNRLATFIVVDGDRAHNIAGERPRLTELIDFCKRQNQKKGSPYILIVNYPDFEYIACLHDPDYNGGNIARHITEQFGYTSVDDFKADTDIYRVLHTPPRDHCNMLERLRNRPKVIENSFNVDGVTINVTDTNENWYSLGQNGSNIAEFFDIVITT